ncbi:glycoside hydrolase family 10 protein [Athelia psychrophila]|uniref:Beta-xylanase n=1 Tax=Athelia psychrophila TaxID=1759441 RepID=A0A166LUH7_9AGAM|nr:glycoside hydrolase family 10 protein [Fibularhizoctonia sp. CBS 109695]
MLLTFYFPVLLSLVSLVSANGLNTAAIAAGKKYFGSATNLEPSDAPYTAILSNTSDFGQLTPANSMKWDATEPTQGVFDFTGGDALVAFAKTNGQVVRGHNCVWYNQLPAWVTSGDFDATDLASIITTHCGTVVGHYKGEIYAWDVVNEPFNDDGTWRTDVFYDTLNSSYVTTALEAAYAADPTAKLYINEYNIEYTGVKATALLTLVQALQAAGTPINGIGFQCHFIVGEVPASLQTVMEQFTALGLEVAVTELDIRFELPSTAALLAQQQEDYETVISVCKNVAGCVGVTLWDYTDKYSWVPSTFSGWGDASPWDENLVIKPAYWGALDGW